MNHLWLTLSETVLIELEQSADEGRDVRAFADEAHLIHEMFGQGKLMEDEARRLLDKIREAPIASDFSFIEPNCLEGIKKARPGNRKTDNSGKPRGGELYDKIYGAWLARCAGCLLGQPVEGWRRGRITGLLKETDNYPVKKYISSNVGEALRAKYRIADEGNVYGSNKINWINNVLHMPEDDDTNYTILYLKTLETYGRNFTSDDVSASWLMNVPLLHVCTAERVAYHNFTNQITPPLSGSYYNAYREWIGAQIRADFFGYINPSDPETAAEYAWRDARISHVKNGIYGEMFVAAMLARAAIDSGIKDIIDAGLGEIPEKSRLTEGVKKVLAWYDEGINWEQAVERINQLWDESNGHHWCHTISNAMICTAGLLWGDGDLEKTIGITICAGFDTDCNAATTGSIIGMMKGAKGLSEQWIKPLGNKIKSGIDGFGLTEISELAERTVNLIQ
ncbi:ADP-ribosylglycohydrolase family protein [Leadbettera azotonutricia]|uniref:ADP-ribosylglycohydrolase family protein n=1 Tax=Leadbettera azotonutricia (strain ATCC BAA-888 / DSM 13862 / ZAS-9) TaxID=545695 RepID=F5YDY4_LEAAZ|nr:ADP-ribosylglycohydrolase family protein [Leadbettera azotonutricia]AEF81942.1 ADP-ribosylglycohydrolase family protein [Leadbettera azotonutricia ZAS-9]